MANVFNDQKKFMKACGQTVDTINELQYNMYLDLITEEVDELWAAINNQDTVEQLDALIDIIVVAVGAIHSMGAEGEGAWKEVMNTNFAKIDKDSGMVRKRDDGKILKPVGWVPPNLRPYVK